MNKWKKRQVPPFCERLIGFSIPQENEILIISYEGVHLLHLGEVITIKTEERLEPYDLYNWELGIAHYQGKKYQIIGLHGGSPLLEGRVGENLLLDTRNETLAITCHSKTELSLKYQNYSGDWAVATFSSEGRYVVLGCPYDFDFMILERADNV